MTATWGLVIKMLYKVLRPTLVKLAEDSSNEADDVLIKVADELL